MISMTLYCDVKLIKAASQQKPGQGCYEKWETPRVIAQGESLFDSATEDGWDIDKVKWRVTCPYCKIQRRKRQTEK